MEGFIKVEEIMIKPELIAFSDEEEKPDEKPLNTSRTTAPSAVQIQKLIDFLCEHRYLAMGYARTTNARIRNRSAWQQIGNNLNREGVGCRKNWQQWAKYWKDKKAAVKKKYSQVRLAIQTNGGVGDEEFFLSPIEERIVGLMGGEKFAGGDAHSETKSFSHHTQSEMPSPVVMMSQEPNSTYTISPALSERILQEAPQQRTTQNTLQPASVRVPTIEDAPQNPHSTEPPGIRPRPPRPTSRASSPRRRRLLEARRMSVRQRPQMTSLTERFLMIEERRAETEKLLAENQRELVKALQTMSEAWLKQSQALQDLVRNKDA